MRQDLKMSEITTSIFNKIDLRIDGVPEEAISRDEKRMKDIPEVIQKLEESEVHLGENSNQEDCIYPEEMVKKIEDLLMVGFMD